MPRATCLFDFINIDYINHGFFCSNFSTFSQGFLNFHVPICIIFSFQLISNLVNLILSILILFGYRCFCESFKCRLFLRFLPGMLVCRIEEEHLWESKQLGAHSPHVLLNTLIYFNTKHFMLRTPQEHLNLSFSHIMKHWKKTNSPSGKPGRSVYLRYYSPSVAGQYNVS